MIVNFHRTFLKYCKGLNLNVLFFFWLLFSHLVILYGL
jgi:hypothetical protein